jgi:L-ectoine synthase
MKSKNANDVVGVEFTGGKSYRTVLQNDGVGFAMMKTCIEKGGPYKWHYQNHQEACYCISGTGYVEDMTNGEITLIKEGVTYIVDNHQPHLFTATTDVVLISVFNPPLRGDETHDEKGNYN